MMELAPRLPLNVDASLLQPRNSNSLLSPSKENRLFPSGSDVPHEFEYPETRMRILEVIGPSSLLPFQTDSLASFILP